jgi:hypothetical protein
MIPYLPRQNLVIKILVFFINNMISVKVAELVVGQFTYECLSIFSSIL